MSSASKGSERESFVDDFLSKAMPTHFRFGSGDTSDDFNLIDLNGGNPIPLTAGSEVVFAMAGDAADSARVAGITFGLSEQAVPEPNALVVIGIALIASLWRQGLRKPPWGRI